MDRMDLLRDASQADDQLLETDIMRFMAIIGIVFWIIFSLIKAVSFQDQETEAKIIHKAAKSIAVKDLSRSTPKQPITKGSKQIADKKRQSAVVEDSDSDASQSANSGRIQRSLTPKRLGVFMQFRSIEDLLALKADEKVQVFCRARARGFDLFFAGHSVGNEVRFKGVTTLPLKLWEIKSGKDHAYFLSLLDKTYPAIRTFPNLQVLVSFADEKLGYHLEQSMDRLQQEGKNGILSISKMGDLKFEEFEPIEDNLKPNKTKGD